MPEGKDISAVEDSAGYFNKKAKELDAILDGIEVPPHVGAEAAKSAILTSGRDAIVESIPVVGVWISKVLGWNDQVNEGLKQHKRDHLLIEYIGRSNDQAAALDQIKKLITSPQGNVLFNKILWILDDNPPDPELSRHLSAALKTIADSGDFAGLFEEHKFALEVIARTSAAALAILTDKARWPIFPMSTTYAQGNRITNDWVPEFARVYVAHLSMADAYERIASALGELQRSGLVWARKIGDSNGEIAIEYTQLGAGVLRYLDQG